MAKNNNDDKEREERSLRLRSLQDSQQMGDVYDVYKKAAAVHSNITDMTEDYTLTQYDIDIFSLKFPKFVKEQRKVLRIIKSYLIIDKEVLARYYNSPTVVDDIHRALVREYGLIEQVLLGELDELVIMARAPKGEVIKAFLKHGLRSNDADLESYDSEVERPSLKSRLMEKKL